MYQRINFSNFQDAFHAYDRAQSFPYGLRYLFNWLKQYEEDTGEEIELDVISLCCDFSEAPLSQVLKETGLSSLEELMENTLVIMVDDEREEDPILIWQSF